MSRRVFGWMFAWLLMVGVAGAQQGTSEVRGRVLDGTGASLPGVTVTVRNQDTGMFRETLSGDSGAFIASALVPGRYEVSATLQGFKTFKRNDLQLEVGRTATIDVTMEVGGMEEVITVTAGTPLVDVTSKEIGGNISTETLVQLPSVNGNFIGFIGLLPGIVPSISTESFGSDAISVNGQDPRNNNYTVDGGNNNDDVIGQRAGMQARTPIEAVQEFQVLTGQYDAEYGRTTGAVVNAVIKSGTNVLHGSAFGFFQDSGLTSKDFLAKQRDLAKADTSYQRWGGVIGGPVIKDRMHFFASLERFAIDRANTIVFPTRADLNDQQTTQDRVWNTIVRADHQLSSNHTYNVRWLREQSPQLNQIVPTGAVFPTGLASREESDVDQSLAVNLNSVLSNSKVNTLRLTWTRENVTFANACYNGNGRDLAGCEPTLAYQNFITQQDNTAQFRINDGISFDDTLSWFLPGKRGDHDIKAGVQYVYSGALNENQGNLNGTFAFGQNDLDFDPANPRTYPDRFTVRVGGPSRFYEKATYFAGFLQDKWRMTPRITLSLGLRYDLEVIPIAETDNPLLESYPVDKNNVQPRVGVTYDLGGGKSVVRAGYGRFFEKTHFELIGGLYTGTPFTKSFLVTFPTSAADPGPRAGRLPTDPYLLNGPVINRALIEQQFPAGRLLRNTGASWDNADRVVPYSDEITLGYERQLAASLAVSADYVHAASRDLLMSVDLNPGLRATTAATSALVRQASPSLADAYVALRNTYPGFANFTTAVTQPLNVGEIDYDALLLSVNKRFGNNYEARVSYTLSKSRGNTSAAGVAASGFQVLDDMHLELNEGPSNFDLRHNFVVSGRAVIPRTGGLNVSWVARALSGSPFTLVNNTIDPDRNGTFAEPLAAGTYSGNGQNAYTVENVAERNGAYGPG
ncbi:MAG: TonB-dependent receptor, partial [Vicinamibacteraceae bacterium]